ncbi:MAG: T9SS type A sorting domain-containing protein [Parafilimonas sp.]
MKKTFLLAAFILGSVTATFATIHVVRVSNFQFSPKTTNAVIGDTIVWVWKNGGHTTSSTLIPVGATPWDAPININNKRFGIRVMVAGTYKYRCNIHPTTMKGTINVTAALAAGLHEFNVTTLEKNAFITWKTQVNKDVSYFSVQRSLDGDNFSEIARIKPNGSQNTYNYTDRSTLQNKYVFYVLEMVDNNGNKQLSEIKMFTKADATTKLITSLSPNPISNPGHLMLQFNADAEGSMLVKLYDSKGQLVNQTEMTAVKGLNNGHFHLGTLTPGTYYLECKLGSITENHTVIFK